MAQAANSCLAMPIGWQRVADWPEVKLVVYPLRWRDGIFVGQANGSNIAIAIG